MMYNARITFVRNIWTYPALLYSCSGQLVSFSLISFRPSPQWRWVGWIIQLYLFIISAIYSTTESIQCYKSLHFASAQFRHIRFYQCCSVVVESGPVGWTKLRSSVFRARRKICWAHTRTHTPWAARALHTQGTKPQFSIVLRQYPWAIKPCRCWCFGKWKCSWMISRPVHSAFESV